MARITRWNADALVAKAEAAFRGYVEGLSPQFDTEIKAVKWPWPVETRRKRKGAPLATSPRDIVDLGRLLASKELYTPDARTAAYKWDPVNPDTGERYGRIVQSGIGYVNRRGAAIQRPGRDWVSPVVLANPMGPGFAAAWQKLPRVR